ncbi:hypothetical protein BKA67DRAFT_653809 [Truncatella angustata]|uniref:Glycoside hydrolase 131 catalytic N-terminal domain-containing protein n=1 Tax=Truncatella angustata TaxID=152316 RepID=A0A9P8UYF1_9PEZI|nr:uncharacterized protein BKA67DRAFT_653809 [Truncatella angustata]KAH6660642.1 hypothetical protein BKA67DRAFT_653809 [Truncatella angustata]KAH8199131.1 hypothetical protein TruAng_006717 [Truncatella angustata]
MFSHVLYAGLLASFASARPSVRTAQIQCPLVLSGQVPATSQLTDFDSSATSIFNPDYVRASAVPWSEILLFPNVTNSRFDNSSYKSVEVTVNENSIFQTQNGFRRAGLQLVGDTNDAGVGNTGVKTLHWSVKQDPTRTLNLTHEYLNVWHERSDYNGNHFNFETGTLIDQPSYDKNTFKITNRQSQVVWSTPIDNSAWQNFAVTLDFDKNTLQVYYSKGNGPLAAVTTALSNDNSGYGQYQIGILKKPTGTSDVVNSGYQESPIDEGQIYGGIFLEDSAAGCISL